MTALGGVAAVLAVAAGSGLWLWGGERSLPTAAAGDAMRIELVAPVEPTPEPGSRMEVGEVTDGFVYVKADLEPAAEPAEDYWVEDSWDEETGYRPPSRPVVEGPRAYAEETDAMVYRRVAPADAAPDPDRAFGFDQPRRDFRAEREARRARLESLAMRSSERTPLPDMTGAMPPDALRRSDSTFY